MLLTAFTMTGCFIDVDDDDFDDDDLFGCIDGDGPLVTETLTIASFDRITLNLPAKVFIKQGPEQEVIVEGKENIIDELELDVNGDNWDIEIDDCVKDIGDMKFFITLPDIRALRIDGSGDIISENVLQIGDIFLSISGSGTIDVALEADDIEGTISGSGEIFMEGTCDSFDLLISGSGDIKAFDLQGSDGLIEIVGSGDAQLSATDDLTVRITGSGDVFYLGNPELDVEVTGSGDVVKCESPNNC